MTTRYRTRKGSFPWGLVLLGAAGYFLYQHSKATTAPATIAPGEPLPPTMPTTTALSTASPAQLQLPPVTVDPRTIVLQAAQSINTPAWLSFAQTGSDADIATMASIIQGEWAQYGRCHTDQCTATWSAIANKYNLY